MFNLLSMAKVGLLLTLPAIATAQSRHPVSGSDSLQQVSAPPAYSSVFDSYKPYAEEKRADWREANDETARIGGWRAYAKEASEANPAAAAPIPAVIATPAVKP
jgi:hypothetical protein